MRIFVLFGVLVSFGVEAAEPFLYDSQLAVDLATAYVRAHFRKRPEHAVPSLSFEAPVVTAAVAKGKRKLVFVSFSSREKPAGAFVMLEYCEENGLLVAAESGTVSNVARYRKRMSEINDHDFVEAPRVCPRD
jgi:alpha/beta superfamily hydrolase